MADQKIIFPDKLLGTVQIPVRVTDINYGNHVGNDAFVSIIHEARVQWLKKHNFTELNIEGVGLIMSSLQVQFKNESFYGDIIEVKIACNNISHVKFELLYELSTIRNEKWLLLALASTTMVCYDYVKKKVSAIPAKFQKILESKV